ncbi:MAG: ornithine carbamoyltransferase [Cellulosilyticaceae bacterium]
MFGLKGKSLITLHDYTGEQIDYVLTLAAQLKAKKQMGIKGDLLAGKNIALIFEKPSTRTRCAFTVACVDEGAHPEYLGKDDIQLGYKESVEDTARVLGRLFDGIEFRGFSQQTVELLAEYSGVPVYNGLTDCYHPTQILADLLTIKEKLGVLKGKKFVYIGDGRNNMANSLMIGCTKMGMDITIVAPKDLWPEESLIETCKAYASKEACTLLVTDHLQGVVGADVIYTDVWCSMGEEEKAKERVEMLKPYQVNEALIEKVGNPHMIFMHCLPAVKGNEVTEEVFEGKYSVVFDQAENRMHTIKAIMVATLG